MSGLPFILTPTGRARLINPENTGTSGLTISHIGVSASDAGVVGGVLQGEIKRLDTFAGQVVADDTIHVTIRDDSADVYSLRAFALYFEDGTLMGWHAQPAVILEKSAQAMLLMSGDIQFQNLDVTTLIFGDSNWTNPVATATVFGVLRLATNEAALSGVSQVDAVTPAGLLHVLNSRFGAGAPSAFVKGLLGMATAALFRAAIGLGSASLRNEGAGNGLDADLLDGQHGAYYRDWDNLTGKPATFTPTAHGHPWAEISGAPATATRWPTFDEVTGKPSTFPPSAHVHSASEVTSGTFAPARISAGSVTQHQSALAIGWSQVFDAGNLGAWRSIATTSKVDTGGAFADAAGSNPQYWQGGAGFDVNNMAPGSRVLVSQTGNTNHPNAPGVSFYYIECKNSYTGAGTLNQTAWTYNGATPELWTRHLQGGNWSQWARYWNSANFDPASKLNASGGTVTGNLTLSPALASGGLYLTTAGGLAGNVTLSGALNTMNIGTSSNNAVCIYTNGVLRMTFNTGGDSIAAGSLVAAQNFYSSTANLVLANGGAGAIYFRPKGINSTDGQMQLGNTGNLTIAGVCVASGGFGPASSREVKRDLIPLPYGLADIERVEVKAGYYRDEYNDDGRRRLFVIAEQVAEVIPEAIMPGVIPWGDAAVDAVDYMQLVPALIRAVQELSAEVRELKSR